MRLGTNPPRFCSALPVMVNGTPLCILTAPETCHPSRSAAIAPPLVSQRLLGPNGSSYPNVMLLRCRWWYRESEKSASLFHRNAVSFDSACPELLSVIFEFW